MDESSKRTPTYSGLSNGPILGSAQLRFAEMMDLNKDSVVTRSDGPVDVAEVAKHTSETDCWIIFKGKVYDITRYLDTHPGGREHLLAFAGMDVTEEFMDTHPWVNAEFLLKSLLVGDLNTDDSELKPEIN